MNATYFFNVFYNCYVTNRLKPNTCRGYYVNIYNHILPYFNEQDITKLNVSDIDTFVLALFSKGLSNTSVKYVLSVMRKAFSFGVKRGYLKDNILKYYDLPKADIYSYIILDECQLIKLCTYLENDDIYPCVLLASFYGMRKGEILALTKNDVIWTEETQQYTIIINKTVTDIKGKRELTTTKTKHGIRSILLSKAHSVKLQRYICMRHISCSDYIVQSNKGYLTSNQLLYRFKRALDDLKLPSVRFHDLRHSYATLMLKKGVHPKIISSVLGHSDISTTMNIYSHYDTSMQIDCLRVLDNL